MIIQQQRVRVSVMIEFLVQGRVGIKIRIRVRNRVKVWVMFNVDIYHRSNCPQEQMYSDQEIRTPIFTINFIFLVNLTFPSGTSLRWSLSHYAKYVDEQRKVQEELDRVVGRDRLPTLEDKT